MSIAGGGMKPMGRRNLMENDYTPGIYSITWHAKRLILSPWQIQMVAGQ